MDPKTTTADHATFVLIGHIYAMRHKKLMVIGQVTVHCISTVLLYFLLINCIVLLETKSGRLQNMKVHPS